MGVADGTVTFSNGSVTATVIAADVMASNGVIHVIDTVITAPAEEPAPGTIVDVASSTDGFETLVAAVTAAGLADTLSGEGPFTVLAPNDDAFGEIPADVLTDLLDDAAAGGSLLADILGMLGGHLVDIRGIVVAPWSRNISWRQSGLTWAILRHL